MHEISDEEIVQTVRALAAKETRRDHLANTVTTLRGATSAEDIAEQNRCGEAMAELDAEILVELVEKLDRLGLRSAAVLCEHVAREEGLLPPADEA
ncbi:hypothetical protein [Streptomyces noursei]|uniref:hypothetical protein n=1 Tax=Streptomyces noursei TaxID=1971 RepID=UPI000A48F757|nr:hypothetical protein [Streptomyces noursei]